MRPLGVVGLDEVDLSDGHLWVIDEEALELEQIPRSLVELGEGDVLREPLVHLHRVALVDPTRGDLRGKEGLVGKEVRFE